MGQLFTIVAETDDPSVKRVVIDWIYKGNIEFHDVVIVSASEKPPRIFESAHRLYKAGRWDIEVSFETPQSEEGIGKKKEPPIPVDVFE